MVQISSVIAAVPVSPRTTGTKDASGTELGSTGADSGFAGLFAALQLPAQTATSKNPDLTQQVARSGSQLPQFSAPAFLANLGVAADTATGIHQVHLLRLCSRRPRLRTKAGPLR